MAPSVVRAPLRDRPPVGGRVAGRGVGGRSACGRLGSRTIRVTSGSTNRVASGSLGSNLVASGSGANRVASGSGANRVASESGSNRVASESGSGAGSRVASGSMNRVSSASESGVGTGGGVSTPAATWGPRTARLQAEHRSAAADTLAPQWGQVTGGSRLPSYTPKAVRKLCARPNYPPLPQERTSLNLSRRRAKRTGGPLRIYLHKR